MKKYLLIVVQIADAFPHDVMVSRRTIESAAPLSELYEATETEFRRLLKPGFGLCNWHIFPAQGLLDDTAFTVSSAKSIGRLQKPN